VRCDYASLPGIINANANIPSGPSVPYTNHVMANLEGCRLFPLLPLLLLLRLPHFFILHLLNAVGPSFLGFVLYSSRAARRVCEARIRLSIERSRDRVRERVGTCPSAGLRASRPHCNHSGQERDHIHGRDISMTRLPIALQSRPAHSISLCSSADNPSTTPHCPLFPRQRRSRNPPPCNRSVLVCVPRSGIHLGLPV
jgi:hypothetical protein